MSVFDRFEQNVKKVVDNAFSRAFKSQIKPVDIASALRNLADNTAEALDRQRTITANVYTVHLSQHDFDEITQTYGSHSLAQELATGLQEHIHSQNYIVAGPVSVELQVDDEQKSGRMHVTCTSKASEKPEQPDENALEYPMIDVDGQRYLLTREVTVLGRGSEADIVVSDQGVSRRHIEFRVGPGGVIVNDLGSTNGMFVEGHQVPAATLVDGNTITIGRTKIMFWQAYSAAPSGFES